MPAQLGIQIWIRMKDFENYLPVCERINQYLCSNAFKIFKETFPLVKIKQYEIFCFETKISFKKHVFWSKKFAVSDTNSFEQFAGGPEVDEFT